VAFADNYCTDGDFSGFERALGGAEGFLHPEFVGFGREFGRWSLVVGRWHGGTEALGSRVTFACPLPCRNHSV
jgi:hypothetical protein